MFTYSLYPKLLSVKTLEPVFDVDGQLFAPLSGPILGKARLLSIERICRRHVQNDRAGGRRRSFLRRRPRHAADSPEQHKPLIYSGI